MRKAISSAILLIAVNARFDTLEDMLRLPLDLRECNGESRDIEGKEGEVNRRARVRIPKP